MAEEGQQLIQLELNGENVLVAVDKDGSAQTVDEATLAGDMVLQTMIESVQPGEAEILHEEAEMEVEEEEEAVEKVVTVTLPADDKSEVIEAAEKIASLPSDGGDKSGTRGKNETEASPEVIDDSSDSEPTIIPPPKPELIELSDASDDPGTPTGSVPSKTASAQAALAKLLSRTKTGNPTSPPTRTVSSDSKSSSGRLSESPKPPEEKIKITETEERAFKDLGILKMERVESETDSTDDSASESGLLISSVASVAEPESFTEVSRPEKLNLEPNADITDNLEPVENGNNSEPFLMIQDVCSLAPEKPDTAAVSVASSRTVDDSVKLVRVEESTPSNSGLQDLPVGARDFKPSLSTIIPEAKPEDKKKKEDISRLKMDMVILGAEEHETETDEVAGILKKVKVFLGTVNGAVTLYYCNYCCYNSSNRNVFLSHVVRHLFLCKTCSYKSFSRVKVLTHSKIHNPIPNTFKKYGTPGAIQTDFAVLGLPPQGQDPVAMKMPSLGSSQEIIKSCGHGNRFFCLHCPFRCRWPIVMDSHVLVHLGVWECRRCGCTFMNDSQLAEHFKKICPPVQGVQVHAIKRLTNRGYKTRDPREAEETIRKLTGDYSLNITTEKMEITSSQYYDIVRDYPYLAVLKVTHIYVQPPESLPKPGTRSYMCSLCPSRSMFPSMVMIHALMEHKAKYSDGAFRSGDDTFCIKFLNSNENLTISAPFSSRLKPVVPIFTDRELKSSAPSPAVAVPQCKSSMKATTAAHALGQSQSSAMTSQSSRMTSQPSTALSATSMKEDFGPESSVGHPESEVDSNTRADPSSMGDSESDCGMRIAEDSDNDSDEMNAASSASPSLASDDVTKPSDDVTRDGWPAIVSEKKLPYEIQDTDISMFRFDAYVEYKEGKINCRYCQFYVPLIFANRSRMMRHLVDHLGPTIYHCSECAFKGSTKINNSAAFETTAILPMLSHWLSKHPSFDRPIIYKIHLFCRPQAGLENSHLSTILDELFQCQVCAKQKPDLRAMKQHMRTLHPQAPLEFKNFEIYRVSGREKSAPNIVKACPEKKCLFTAFDDSDLAKHECTSKDEENSDSSDSDLEEVDDTDLNYDPDAPKRKKRKLEAWLEPGGGFSCYFCSYKADKAHIMIMHIRSNHLRDCACVMQANGVDSSNNAEIVFFCYEPKCDFSSIELSAMLAHYNEIISHKPSLRERDFLKNGYFESTLDEDVMKRQETETEKGLLPVPYEMIHGKFCSKPKYALRCLYCINQDQFTTQRAQSDLMMSHHLRREHKTLPPIAFQPSPHGSYAWKGKYHLFCDKVACTFTVAYTNDENLARNLNYSHHVKNCKNKQGLGFQGVPAKFAETWYKGVDRLMKKVGSWPLETDQWFTYLNLNVKNLSVRLQGAIAMAEGSSEVAQGSNEDSEDVLAASSVADDEREEKLLTVTPLIQEEVERDDENEVAAEKSGIFPKVKTIKLERVFEEEDDEEMRDEEEEEKSGEEKKRDEEGGGEIMDVDGSSSRVKSEALSDEDSKRGDIKEAQVSGSSSPDEGDSNVLEGEEEKGLIVALKKEPEVSEDK